MKTFARVIYWIPRVLGIIAILLISLFALDSFEPGLPFFKQLTAFLMHMVPSFLLTIFLIVAWNKELVGGIIFILIGLGFSPFIYSHNYSMNHSVWESIGVLLIITFPFVLTGLLFIISYFSKKKSKP